MNIHVPDWLATPYDIQINSKGHKFNIEDELIEMHVDLEAKPLFKGKNLAEYWSNIITVTTNPKLRAAVGPLLLAFPSSYMVDAGLSHVNAMSY